MTECGCCNDSFPNIKFVYPYYASIFRIGSDDSLEFGYNHFDETGATGTRQGYFYRPVGSGYIWCGRLVAVDIGGGIDYYAGGFDSSDDSSYKTNFLIGATSSQKANSIPLHCDDNGYLYGALLSDSFSVTPGTGSIIGGSSSYIINYVNDYSGLSWRRGASSFDLRGTALGSVYETNSPLDAGFNGVHFMDSAQTYGYQASGTTCVKFDYSQGSVTPVEWTATASFTSTGWRITSSDGLVVMSTRSATSFGKTTGDGSTEDCEAFDSSGNKLWNLRTDILSSGKVNNVIEQSGTYYICGSELKHKDDVDSSYESIVIAVDYTGAELWNSDSFETYKELNGNSKYSQTGSAWNCYESGGKKYIACAGVRLM